MATGAQLAIAISQSGAGPVEKALEGVARTVKGLAGAATAPLKALGGLGGALGDIGKIAGGFALGGVLTALPGQLLDMAQGAAADEQATMRLAQSIRNLGGDFEGIMGQVEDAIAAGQKLAFTDDEVRDSFQFLAAATGDADEALRRQKAAMDLARGANIPLSMATKMLGKLNEENIEVFKKLGITLGDTATEADALAAVQAKFGGQASAFANSTAGQFEQAKIAISEIQESIGSALLPLLAAVGAVLTENLPAIQEWVGAFASGVANTIGPALEALAPLVRDVFGQVMTFLEPIMAVLPDLGTAIGQAFAFFTTGGGDIETFRGVLNRLLGPEGAQGVIVAFTSLTGFVHNDLIPAFQLVGEIVGKVISGDLSGALSQVGDIVKAVAPQIGQALVTWGQQFAQWVGIMWPPFQAELLRLGTMVLDWARAEGPQLAAVLVQWGQEFIAWIGPMIPPFLAELGKMALALLGWVAEQAVVINQKAYTEWVPALVQWIVAVWPSLQDGLARFRSALGEWIVNEAAPWLGRQALEIGGALVRGIWKGLQEHEKWLWGKIQEMLAGALAAAKRAAGISSPSQVWADEIGVPIMEGIVAGILGGAPELTAAVEEVVAPIRDLGFVIENELAPAFDLVAHTGSEALDEMTPTSGLVQTFTKLNETVGTDLVDAFKMLREEVTDMLHDARQSALDLMGYLSEILSMLKRIDVPSPPGGGAGGGGGGDRGPTWGLFPDPGGPGSPSNPGDENAASRAATVTIYQTIDAREQGARAVSDGTFDALVRARLISGATG